MVAAVLTADAQGLHFMDVEMGSTRDAFNTSFIEKGFSEPQVQGDVEFYKHGTFEGCDSSTVAIYKSPDEKIRRVVAYVNVKDEVEAKRCDEESRPAFSRPEQRLYSQRSVGQRQDSSHILTQRRLCRLHSH